MLICFIGVDGSGKTTHATSLLHFLVDRGYSVKYVRAASRPVLTYPFLVATRVMGYWNSIKKDRYTDPLEKAAPNIKRRIAALYRFLLLIDFELVSFLKVQLPLLSGRVVVCDRFAYDLIVDLALSDLHSPSFADLVLKSTPKPRKTFFTDSSEDVLMERRGNMPKALIHAKVKAYRKLAQTLNFTTICTEDPFEISQNRIRREVMVLLKMCDKRIARPERA